MKVTNNPVNYPIFLKLASRGNNQPCIEMRKAVTQKEVIKIILERAIANKPIVVFPTFRDHLRAIATLNEKKIIKYNYDDNTYSFLI